jgi:hypothetical protein
MITATQIKDRLGKEKDPLQYIDGEISSCVNQMGDRCANIQGTISIYNNRVNKNEQIDMQKIKEDLIKMGEMYYEINLYLKVRKEQIKHQKRAEQVNRALAKKQKRIE